MRARTAVALLATVAAAALGPGAGVAVACDRWAAAKGSDRSAGTVTRPYRSVGKLLSRLRPGQTGCLAPGSTFTGSIRISTRGITLRTPGGRRAEIRGAITIARGATGVTLSQLAVRGPRSRRAPIVLVRGDRARLLRNDITGLSTAPRAVTCVALDGVSGAVVDGNEIHHCTRTTSRRITATGVLARRTRGGRIANNFVSNVIGNAVTLDGARGLAVHHNLVDGNVTGILLRNGASSNRIVSNIVSRAGRNLVRSTVGPPDGRTNVVAANCLWRGYRGNLAGAGRGFRTAGNLVASPRFVNRPRTFQLRAGPCFGKRPYATRSLRRAAALTRPAAVRSAPVRATAPPPPPAIRPAAPVPAPARTAIVPAFRVRYRLLARPGSVRVVALTAVGLSPSLRVRVACVSGCRASSPLRVGAGGTASIDRFRGRTLGRGTVIDVRATRAGAAGHVARITITGLPSGVRIEHGCLPPSGGATFVPCAAYG